jgi:hypothetical protein
MVNAIGAGAHHSISGIYDSTQRVTIDGFVVQFQLVYPHPFLIVEVKPDSGVPRQWRVELDNRGELQAIGITAETFKAGDRVVINGLPARAQTPSLYAMRLDRLADGFWYEQVGLSPRIGIQ